MSGVPDQALEAKARRELRLKQVLRTRYLQAIGAGLAQAAAVAGGANAERKAEARLVTLGADLCEILEESAASLYLEALEFWKQATPPEFAATITAADEIRRVAQIRRSRPTTAGGVRDRIPHAVAEIKKAFPADDRRAYSWRQRSAESLAAACDSVLNDLAVYLDRVARRDATAPEFRTAAPTITD